MTLLEQLSKLPTLQDIANQTELVNDMPHRILLKTAHEGDFVVAHAQLQQMKNDFHKRAPLEQRIRELTFAQQEQKHQHEQAIKAKAKQEFAEKYKLYQQNCQRLLNDYYELRNLGRANPSFYFDELGEAKLHLPAIHPQGDIGATGGSLVK